MNKNKLEKVIRKEIKKSPPNYHRCHEAARIIARKLRSLGMDIVVKDGGVIYDTSYFTNDMGDFLPASFFKNLSKEEKRELLRELRGEKIKDKLFILHSWCEIGENSSNLVVDYHASLKLSSDCGIDNKLIIDEKNNLPHTYVPMGIAIGKWIIFGTFPPRAIKLRL